MCAFFQICVDVCILTQFWIYRNAKPDQLSKVKEDNIVVLDTTSTTIAEADKERTCKLNSSYSIVSTKSGTSSPQVDGTMVEEEDDKEHAC